MTQRLRFGLDLDGVVYDFHSSFRFLANHQFGLNLPDVGEIWDKWDGHRRFMTDEQDAWMWTEGIKRGLFRHGHVRKGAIEFCQELDKLADIIIVTHRPLEARQDTLDWLAFHQIPTSEIHMLHAMQDKGAVKTHVALDDKLENAERFAAGGASPSLLWDRPWNRGQESPHNKVYRANSWGTVLEWVKAVKMTAAS